MRVLLYGITRATAPDPVGEGMGGRPLRPLTCEPLKAVISDGATPPPRDPHHMWAYHAVVERLAQHSPILPARYGSMGDEAEIATMLAGRGRELSRALDRVGDAVEFVVHTPETAEPAPADPGPSGRPGIAYMRRRLEREQALRELEAIAASFTRCPPRRLGRGLACLVDRARAERFLSYVAEHGATAYGPWPPFSFVA
jgi:hypothetical protein